MIKLALDGTLRRNALSSACLRLVGHLSCAFVAVSMTFHSQAFSRFLTRFLAEMLNCGAVLGVNSGGPPVVYLQCLQILRHFWCDSLFVGDASMSGLGFVNVDAQNTRSRKFATSQNAGVGTSKQQFKPVRTHACHTKQPQLTAPLYSARCHQTFSFLKVGTWHTGASRTSMKTSCGSRAGRAFEVCLRHGHDTLGGPSSS